MSPAGRRTAGPIGFSDQYGPRWPQDGAKTAKMAHHVGSWPPRWFQMVQDGPQDASKMVQDASQTAQETPKTPQDEPPKAKILQKPMVLLYDFYDSPSERHGGSKRPLESPKGPPRRPKMAPRRPKMARRPPQDGP